MNGAIPSLLPLFSPVKKGSHDQGEKMSSTDRPPEAMDQITEVVFSILPASPTKTTSVKKLPPFTVVYEATLVNWWALASVIGALGVCVIVAFVIRGFRKREKGRVT